RCETIRCRRRKIVSQRPVPKSLTCHKTPRGGFVGRIDIHRLAYPSDAEPTLHLLQDGEHLRHSVHVMMTVKMADTHVSRSHPLNLRTPLSEQSRLQCACDIHLAQPVAGKTTGVV